MAELWKYCCPICAENLHFADRLQQHLKEEHGNKQLGYALLEAAPVNFLVVNKTGAVFQKTNRDELCWMSIISNEGYSTWQLMRHNAPIFRVVGETNG